MRLIFADEYVRNFSQGFVFDRICKFPLFGVKEALPNNKGGEIANHAQDNCNPHYQGIFHGHHMSIPSLEFHTSLVSRRYTRRYNQ